MVIGANSKCCANEMRGVDSLVPPMAGIRRRSVSHPPVCQLSWSLRPLSQVCRFQTSLSDCRRGTRHWHRWRLLLQVS